MAPPTSCCVLYFLLGGATYLLLRLVRPTRWSHLPPVASCTSSPGRCRGRRVRDEGPPTPVARPSSHVPPPSRQLPDRLQQMQIISIITQSIAALKFVAAIGSICCYLFKFPNIFIFIVNRPFRMRKQIKRAIQSSRTFVMPKRKAIFSGAFVCICDATCYIKKAGSHWQQILQHIDITCLTYHVVRMSWTRTPHYNKGRQYTRFP